MRENYIPFLPEVRKQVKQEQEFKCAWCGSSGCDLSVHHIVPSSVAQDMGWPASKIRARENAVALCEYDHETFDILALTHNQFFDEIMMDHGKEYKIPKRPRRNPPQTQVRDIVRFVHR